MPAGAGEGGQTGPGALAGAQPAPGAVRQGPRRLHGRRQPAQDACGLQHPTRPGLRWYCGRHHPAADREGWALLSLTHFFPRQP